jgi:hypothetical protein
MAILSEPRNDASGRVYGRAVVNPCAIAAIENADQQPDVILALNVSGDWCELDAHDRKDNELSLEQGFRFLEDKDKLFDNCLLSRVSHD